MHVYIEAPYTFDDDVNIMSSTITGDEFFVDGKCVFPQIGGHHRYQTTVKLLPKPYIYL